MSGKECTKADHCTCGCIGAAGRLFESIVNSGYHLQTTEDNFKLYNECLNVVRGIPTKKDQEQKGAF